MLTDQWADKEDFKRAYGYELSDIEDAHGADCLILSVAHQEYRENTLADWDRYFKEMSNSEKVIIDVKSILDREQVLSEGYLYWRL